jgi:hypothetical protein
LPGVQDASCAVGIADRRAVELVPDYEAHTGKYPCHAFFWARGKRPGAGAPGRQAGCLGGEAHNPYQPILTAT